ncbi:hypothetical protein Tco_0569624 [Tanacetum coccineum]
MYVTMARFQRTASDGPKTKQSPKNTNVAMEAHSINPKNTTLNNSVPLSGKPSFVSIVHGSTNTKGETSSSVKVDEHIIWVEISGLPFCAWGSNSFKKVAFHELGTWSINVADDPHDSLPLEDENNNERQRDDVVINTEWVPIDMDNHYCVLFSILFGLYLNIEERFLSIGGCLTLIKSFLESLGLYYLSIFKIPKTILKNLECVAWAIRGFDHQGCKTNRLLEKIFGSSNYLHSSGILLVDSLRLKVGCGTLVRFWNWLGDPPLSSLVNRFDLGVRNSAYLIDMLAEIGHVVIDSDEDACFLSLANDGAFSVC